MSTSYFIQYPVKGEQASMIEARLRGIHSTLLLQLGVKARLMKNVDHPLHWLEVYENIVGMSAFEKMLDHEFSKNGLYDLIGRDTRKIARFHF